MNNKSLFPILVVSVIAAVISSCANSTSEKQVINQQQDKAEIMYPHELLDTLSDAPVVFYNVENLFDTIDDPEKKDEDFLPESKKNWNAERYKDKLEKLSDVITSTSKKNPVFIGLAEVENRFVVQDLLTTERLANSKYRIAYFESPDVRGIDVALAFDHNLFQMTFKEAIKVSFEDEPNFKTRDILYVKGVFYDSTEAHVFVNHWSSRRGGQEKSEYKRVKAAQLLKGKVDSILALNSSANIIIMGDFNDYPTNTSVSNVLEAGSKDDHKKLVNLMLTYHEKGQGTHNYKGEWGALDQIIVSNGLLDEKGLEIKNGKANILYDDKFLYTKKDGSKTPNRTYGGNSYFGGYSDHLAVYSTLSIVSK